MPGARCTRGLACNGDGRGAHEHKGEAESIRHSLRNGFTAYNVISPVGPGSLSPSLARNDPYWGCAIFASLTPASGRQDHTSLPYASVPFVKGISASTAPRPAFVTIASAPLVGTGCNLYSPVRASDKEKYLRFSELFRLTRFLSIRSELPRLRQPPSSEGGLRRVKRLRRVRPSGSFIDFAVILSSTYGPKLERP